MKNWILKMIRYFDGFAIERIKIQIPLKTVVGIYTPQLKRNEISCSFYIDKFLASLTKVSINHIA